MNTAPNPTSPFVMPGKYTVKLVVDGGSYLQSFMVKMDPRVKTALKDLQLQHDLSLEAYNSRKELLQMMAAFGNTPGNNRQGNNNQNGVVTLAQRMAQLAGNFASLHDQLQDSDMPPTSQMIRAMKEARGKFLEVKRDYAK
jgi:hypothetical protein